MDLPRALPRRSTPDSCRSVSAQRHQVTTAVHQQVCVPDPKPSLVSAHVWPQVIAVNRQRQATLLETVLDAIPEQQQRARKRDQAAADNTAFLTHMRALKRAAKMERREADRLQALHVRCRSQLVRSAATTRCTDAGCLKYCMSADQFNGIENVRVPQVEKTNDPLHLTLRVSWQTTH